MNEIICMIDVGLKNYVREDTITDIFKPNTSEAKLLSKEAALNKRIIDCTHGKKTKALLLLSTRHLVLSPLKYSYFEKKIKTDSDTITVNNPEN